LNKALGAISENNPVLSGVLEQIDFARLIGKKPVSDPKLRQLITRQGAQTLMSEAYFWVRHNDEGCSATQHPDFLRIRQF
jgi:hypothetical protein